MGYSFVNNTFFKKKTILPPLFIMAAAIALSSCDSSSNSQLNDAQKLTDVLGVPVFLWASKEDICAQKQFHQLLDQFNAASESERSIFLGDVKKYDAIIFNGSQILAPLTGKYRKLQLGDDNGVTAWHDFLDTRTFTELKGTTVHKTSHLVISPQSAPDHSDTRIYQTANADLYALIVSGGENYLEDAVAAQKLQDVTPTDANPVNCGVLVDLKDLY